MSSGGVRHLALGAAGEEQAARYLQHLGYALLGRNVRYPFGEIDIIAQDEQAIVLVEVKTGKTGRFGLAVERVGPQKQRKLRLLARRLEQEYPRATIRIDLVNVDQQGEIRHIKNALEYQAG